LIGQSNMAGRGIPEAEDVTIHPRVWTLTKTEEWAPAKDPLHSDKPQAGVGPGLTFGKVLAEHNPGAWIGLIPSAVGGSSIDKWNKGGRYYEAAIRRAKLAMAHGRLKGILWHQGEAEGDAALIQSYPAKLTQLIADLRQDLGAPDVPVVVGEIGEFRVTATEFNKMIVEAAKTIPLTACVSAAGLQDKMDRTHFDTASQRELGCRYAAAYLELAKSGAR
jgi:hypothetical protein